MSRLCLAADDLTGALDAAAAFAARLGPVTVALSTAAAPLARGHVALDLGTREGARADARAVAGRAAAVLAGGRPAILKIDSLLRGHGVAELAACLGAGRFRHAVLAPAFPHQGRITRRGAQMRREADGSWHVVADLLALLTEAGLPARRGEAGDGLRPGVTIFDAETDRDLDRIASLGAAAPDPILWCGSAGLAAALARREPPADLPALPRLFGPVLGFFGSDQPATAAQLAACQPQWVTMGDGGPQAAAAVASRLAAGAALVSLDLPPGLGRGDAQQRIARAFGALAAALPRPGTLLAAGGETLRGLCDALGAPALEVVGEIEPGLPVSRLRGGRWDGLRVISKSGAFGAPGLWRDLLATIVLQPAEAAQ